MIGTWGVSEPDSALICPVSQGRYNGTDRLGRKYGDHYRMPRQRMGRVNQLYPHSGPGSGSLSPLLLFMAAGTLTMPSLPQVKRKGS